MLCLFIIALLVLVNLFVGKSLHRGEKVYPVESGFLSYNRGLSKFNLSFFMLLLLFILFDIEVLFIVFFPLLGVFLHPVPLVIVGFIFGTLWVEWVWGKLVWY